jgi:CRISPR-associated protein Cas2
VIVLVLTAVPEGLRGDLSRWLLEIAPGVFAGRVSRRVREQLWVRVRRGIVKGGGSAVLVVTAHDREQGYDIVTAGRGRRIPADFDGMTLMRVPGSGTAPVEPGS